MWRRGLLLSATFLLMVFISGACKKKETQIGKGAINQDDLLNSVAVDTFSLYTYTIAEDSVISDNAAYALLGSYVDPVFGTVSSEIYTQFRLSGLNPNFGTDQITIDSLVLGLEYAGYYGKRGDQTIQAFEIIDDEGLSLDSTYYQFTTFKTAHRNLVVPGKETIYMDPNGVTVIDGDTVNTQARIHLDTALARQFIDECLSNPTTFESNDNFLQFFKGLKIKTANFGQMPGEGGVFYFNLNAAMSKMTIYYTQTGIQKVYDLLINSECADFNHVEIDDTGTSVATVINDTNVPGQGQVEFYAQAFRSRAVVHIPGIDSIPKNAVIHRATLELPIQYLSGSQYDPGGALTAVITTEENAHLFYAIAPVTLFDDYTKRYDIDLRAYIQNVLNGNVKNKEILLYPSLFISSVDRIIFNGPQTGNKMKPKLSIIYTEY